MISDFLNNDDNIPIDINYNVIMDNDNSINSNETIILQDDFLNIILHQPYEVSTIKPSENQIINIISNHKKNNLFFILKISIIFSVFSLFIILCIVFIYL
jgi:hypothetical protein